MITRIVSVGACVTRAILTRNLILTIKCFKSRLSSASNQHSEFDVKKHCL